MLGFRWASFYFHAQLPQVLETLRQNTSSSTQAFPAEAQYVNAVLAARAAKGLGEPEDEGEPQKGKKPKKTQKPSMKTTKGNWNYSEIRNGFIKDLRLKGASYQDAAAGWDNSLEKAKFLAPIGLPELRKRRFVEKGCNQNPWLERLQAKPTN